MGVGSGEDGRRLSGARRSVRANTAVFTTDSPRLALHGCGIDDVEQ
jgi:hypothetical protein